MELRFDVIVYSKLGDEDSDAGHVKCPLGWRVAFGPQAAGSPSLIWNDAKPAGVGCEQSFSESEYTKETQTNKRLNRR